MCSCIMQTSTNTAAASMQSLHHACNAWHIQHKSCATSSEYHYLGAANIVWTQYSKLRAARPHPCTMLSSLDTHKTHFYMLLLNSWPVLMPMHTITDSKVLNYFVWGVL